MQPAIIVTVTVHPLKTFLRLHHLHWFMLWSALLIQSAAKILVMATRVACNARHLRSDFKCNAALPAIALIVSPAI